MVGSAIARKTRSGTLVGPGICKKCRPAVAIALALRFYHLSVKPFTLGRLHSISSEAMDSQC